VSRQALHVSRLRRSRPGPFRPCPSSAPTPSKRWVHPGAVRGTSRSLREVPALLGKPTSRILLRDSRERWGRRDPREPGTVSGFASRLRGLPRRRQSESPPHLREDSFLLEELSLTASPMTCPTAGHPPTPGSSGPRKKLHGADFGLTDRAFTVIFEHLREISMPMPGHAACAFASLGAALGLSWLLGSSFRRASRNVQSGSTSRSRPSGWKELVIFSLPGGGEIGCGTGQFPGSTHARRQRKPSAPAAAPPEPPSVAPADAAPLAPTERDLCVTVGPEPGVRALIRRIAPLWAWIRAVEAAGPSRVELRPLRRLPKGAMDDAAHA